MSPDNILHIRHMAPADTDRLVEIWFNASRQAHHFLPLDMLQEQRALIRDIYLPKAETWVAILDEVTVGFISMLGCHIGGLFVDPEMQRRKVGRRLVDHARAEGGPLTVEVYEENGPALAFYGRVGFVPVDRRSIDDLGLPHPLIKMELR